MKLFKKSAAASAAPSTVVPVRHTIWPTFIKKRYIIILLVVLFTAGGALAQGYITRVLPKQALADYLEKPLNAKTAEFNGSVSFSSQDEDLAEFPAQITMRGKFDINDQEKPRLEVGLTGEVSLEEIKADLVVLDKTIYFKVKAAMLEMLELSLSDDWYKYQLEENIFADECSKSEDTGSLFGQQVIRTMPVKNTKLVKLGEVVDGHSTNHFSGEIDMEQLPSTIEQINKDLSADCQIDFDSDDGKDLSIKYDLFTSDNFDRIIIDAHDKSSQSTTKITLDTSSYNQPVEINAPANAKDFATLMDEWSGEDSGSLTVRARDDGRKNDLKNIQSALETYYTDNMFYPQELSVLVPDYMDSIPRDPEGSQYEYSPLDCDEESCEGYVLRAKLENSDDPQASEDGNYEVTSVNSATIQEH